MKASETKQEFGDEVRGGAVLRFTVAALDFFELWWWREMAGWGLGFGVWGWGFAVCGFGFRVSGFGFWVLGLGFISPVSGSWGRVSM